MRDVPAELAFLQYGGPCLRSLLKFEKGGFSLVEPIAARAARRARTQGTWEALQLLKKGFREIT